MKCPSCGFDSFLDAERCKKCGHTFGVGDDDGILSGILIHSSVEDAPEAEVMTSPLEESPPAKPPPARVRQIIESPIQSAPVVSAGLMLPDSPADATGKPPVWKAELDQRVDTFRRRRARGRGAADSNPNLEFDFEDPDQEAAPPPISTVKAEAVFAAPGIDIELPGSTAAAARQAEFGSMEIGDPPAAATLRERDDHFSSIRAVEFVHDHTPPRAAVEPSGTVTVEILLAPMIRRLSGGLIDASVLLFSAGVFALIFWRAGGHISSHPLTLLVVAFVAVFQVLVYFGAFTAIIATTPGLLWMGVEVRSIWGGPPTFRQALWRAVGCLVSASALLLGFVWALFDSDRLTWHDRMSETYLSPADAGTHPSGT